MSELLRDGDRRTAYGLAAKARAAAFTSERMARQTLTTYRKTIGRATALDELK